MKLYIFKLGELVWGLNIDTMQDAVDISFQDITFLENGAKQLRKNINPATTQLVLPPSPLACASLKTMLSYLHIPKQNISFNNNFNVPLECYFKNKYNFDNQNHYDKIKRLFNLSEKIEVCGKLVSLADDRKFKENNSIKNISNALEEIAHDFDDKEAVIIGVAKTTFEKLQNNVDNLRKNFKQNPSSISPRILEFETKLNEPSK